ncbi:PAS domain S-box protein [Bradyrhizobium sp. 83002]|uniref:PAS domain S-box protein n=1 Tax=Bradyrhizobium aeschynomenes TaxID=2734909 RepID=UPI001552D234|nr:PAS domain S-box protein [Bradyrhizobium aeschynomenes]NPU11061.1 PAS domain S-box protein [Bradyrhizobium aeschynomenes]
MGRRNSGTSDAHLAAIVANSFDAIISKDLQGTIRSWNRAAEDIFGWSAREIVGRSIRTIIPADRLREEEHIIERVGAGEIVPRFETVRLNKQGLPIPVEICVSPIRDRAGTIVGASKIASDISRTIELRNRLADSERQFRMLANNIAQLAWIADRDGSIFWYNERWYDYTGTTIEQMKGWGWTGVHHPDHVERVKARIQESWDFGVEWEDTFPLRGKDGTYRWFLSRAKPVLDDTGQIWRWFGTNTDITAQLQSEEKIRLLMGEVNHRAKNMITVVQAIVMRTVDRHDSDALASRLAALGRNQDLLTQHNWNGARLGELISSQLAPVGDLVGSRIILTGDLDVLLSPAASETIGLAIHELGTNATKYGSLSGAAGQVSIACAVIDEANGKRLRIVWRESGGPAVAAPERTGFGSVMIDRNPRLALQAEVQLAFPPEGFVWRLDVPLEQVQAQGSDDSGAGRL